jgi:hypothetical protein
MLPPGVVIFVPTRYEGALNVIGRGPDTEPLSSRKLGEQGEILVTWHIRFQLL